MHKVGDKVKIIYMDDAMAADYTNKEGIITSIDSIGQLHGTWGGLALIPDVDIIEIINPKKYDF